MQKIIHYILLLLLMFSVKPVLAAVVIFEAGFGQQADTWEPLNHTNSHRSLPTQQPPEGELPDFLARLGCAGLVVPNQASVTTLKSLPVCP